MSDNTARPLTSGGDVIRSIDLTTSKVQAFELLVSRAGQELGLASRAHPLSTRDARLWDEVIEAFGRRDEAMRALVERRLKRRRAGAAQPVRQYAGGTLFRRASLPLTGWYAKGYPGGIPGSWPASTSAGTSGGNGAISHATDPANVGAALNGYASADFDGISTRLDSSGTLDTFVSASAYSGWALLDLDTVSSDFGGGGYNNPCIACDVTDFWYLYARSSGLLGVGHYDGAFNQAECAYAIASGPTLVWFKFEAGNIYIATNAGAWSAPVPAGNIAGLAGGFSLGVNGAATQWVDGRVWEFAISDVTISDADRASVRLDINADYGVTL